MERAFKTPFHCLMMPPKNSSQELSLKTPDKDFLSFAWTSDWWWEAQVIFRLYIANTFQLQVNNINYYDRTQTHSPLVHSSPLKKLTWTKLTLTNWHGLFMLMLEICQNKNDYSADLNLTLPSEDLRQFSWTTDFFLD